LVKIARTSSKPFSLCWELLMNAMSTLFALRISKASVLSMDLNIESAPMAWSALPNLESSPSLSSTTRKVIFDRMGSAAFGFALNTTVSTSVPKTGKRQANGPMSR